MSGNPIEWLEWIVSWVLMAFHRILAPVFGEASGVSWGFAIVGLVITIRVLLIPLFVKQIHSQRNLQLIQPKVKEIQKKYAGDREKQSAELMALYRETGTNPLASCFPILAQAPIFFALFQVLQGIAMNHPRGVLTEALVAQAQQAEIFGAPLYATFTHSASTPNPGITRIVTLVLIVLMTLTTFTSQRQMIIKNAAPDNPMVQQQKMMLYIFPVIFAVSGVNFPVGVLVYWFTTNLWAMGQQFYVIRNSPQPGTPAYAAYEARQQAKAIKRGELPATPDEPTRTERNQPKRKNRRDR